MQNFFLDQFNPNFDDHPKVMQKHLKYSSSQLHIHDGLTIHVAHHVPPLLHSRSLRKKIVAFFQTCDVDNELYFPYLVLEVGNYFFQISWQISD